MKKIPVLITTDKRGVFFGKIDPQDYDKSSIVAEDIQMCVRWTADVKGVMGLASNGPSEKCRVSRPTTNGILHGVTMVLTCSDKAVAAWERMPWS